MNRGRVEAVVVGAGLMGRWHAHAIRRTGAVVAGVADVDAGRAGALAAGFGGTRVFGSLDAALDALDPDIVHICTPPESHVPLVHTALTARCHVLAEKPLAATAEETHDLLTLAGEVGRLLVPVHQFGWQRGALQLLDRLGSLGPILHLEAAAASAGAAGGSRGAADVVATDILPHFLALTRRFLGVPLADRPWSVVRPRAGEWRAIVSVGPLSVAYLVSMAARPTYTELRLLGERGSARLDLFHGFAVFEGGTVSQSAKVVRPFGVAARTLLAASVNLAHRVVLREPAYPGLTELVRRVHLAAMGSEANPIPPEETLDLARARDQLVALAAGTGEV
jgi:predicted dehydrogenase